VMKTMFRHSATGSSRDRAVQHEDPEMVVERNPAVIHASDWDELQLATAPPQEPRDLLRALQLLSEPGMAGSLAVAGSSAHVKAWIPRSIIDFGFGDESDQRLVTHGLLQAAVRAADLRWRRESAESNRDVFPDAIPLPELLEAVRQLGIPVESLPADIELADVILLLRSDPCAPVTLRTALAATRFPDSVGSPSTLAAARYALDLNDRLNLLRLGVISADSGKLTFCLAAAPLIPASTWEARGTEALRTWVRLFADGCRQVTDTIRQCLEVLATSEGAEEYLTQNPGLLMASKPDTLEVNA
jgi:hypothetical protein